MMRKLWLPTLVSLALTACAVGPDYNRPKMDLPTQWRADSADAGTVFDRQWWQQFNDPVLDQLIRAALKSNRDLRVAMAKVDESRALLLGTTADQLPNLSLSAQANRARYSTVGISPAAVGNNIGNDKIVNATAAYQLDLWGQYRRASESARASLLATEAARDTVELTLVSQVAQAYFSLRTLDAQLDISQRTLKSRKESLGLREKQYKGGVNSELDYRQAQSDTAVAAIAVPKYEQLVAQAESALKVLLGASPRDIVHGAVERGQPLEQLNVPPAVPAGLPSELLQRRPDVREAEQNLIAANAKIGQARAAYFPSISLTAALGSESTSLVNLFTGPAGTWSFASALAMPLIDFGKTRSQVAAASAREQQALASYEKTVETAFSDAQNALVANRKTREQEVAQQEQVDALHRALKLAQLRYDNGYSSYLDVLDAERSLFSAELNLASARQAQLDAVVSVYQALGGGWQPAAQ